MIIRRLPRTRLARASHTPARYAHAPAPRVADGILCRYPLEVTKTKVQAFGGSSKTSNRGAPSLCLLYRPTAIMSPSFQWRLRRSA